MKLEFTTEQAETLYEVLDDAVDAAIDGIRDLDQEEQADHQAYIDELCVLKDKIKTELNKEEPC